MQVRHSEGVAIHADPESCAAFMHQDGDGCNVVLQALPINGKVVLRLPKSDGKEGDTERAQQTIREVNDRRKNARRDK